MKFKTIHNYKSAPPQEFTQFSDEWKYSENEGAPVLVGKKDDQAFIQSHEDCALSKVFDKFLPEDFDEFAANFGKKIEVDLKAPAIPAEEARADLDYIAEVASGIDELREAYGISDDLPRAAVLEEAQKRAKEIIERDKQSNKVAYGNVSAGSGNNNGVDSATDKPVEPVQNA